MVASTSKTNDEIRSLILRYLYSRNCTATSVRGKKGAAVKIGDMRRELKASQNLCREDVVSNLRYLISQGWVEEQCQERVVPTTGGRRIPSTTIYYAVTAKGIDKIEGASEFTPRDRFKGIVNISATGQSMVTVGDGNQVNVKYELEGKSLSGLADAIKNTSELDTKRKMDAVSDIDTIQSQLARSEPNTTVIRAAWSSIQPLTQIAQLAGLVIAVGEKLSSFLN